MRTDRETAVYGIRAKTVGGLGVGDVFTVSHTFTEEEMVRFGDMIRDYNPVHYDDRFASLKKFRGRICHGMHVAALISEIGGQIGWLATRMDLHFMRPTYFGDTVTCTFTLTSIDTRGKAEGSAVYRNQDGVEVLRAFLYGFIPGPHERRILEEMLKEE